ncbi:MAG: nicotinate-nucleotide adenylyltransferase [Aquisalimonadaceae bacterium]
MTQLVGIFGGTFDPVHNAHLRVAMDVLEEASLDEVRLIPAHQPPHRDTPSVGSAERLQMLRMAVNGESRMVVDDRELRRDGPSYTVDTLATLHADFPDAHLCLLLGTDSFRSLPGWNRWRELSRFAHIVVMKRPEMDSPPMPDDLTHWLSGRETADWARLRAEPAGRVIFQAVTPLGISATDIRQRLASGRSGRYLMPDAVWDHIRTHGLYGAGSAGSRRTQR